MRHLPVFVLILLGACSSGGDGPAPLAANEVSMRDLRWEHRLLVIRPEDVATTESTLAAAADELTDRDMLWFIFSGTDVRTNLEGQPGATLLDELEELLDEAKSEVVLVGKDGGVKRRAERLDLEAVCGLIDTMPMRRREVRERKSD